MRFSPRFLFLGLFSSVLSAQTTYENHQFYSFVPPAEVAGAEGASAVLLVKDARRATIMPAAEEWLDDFKRKGKVVQNGSHIERATFFAENLEPTDTLSAMMDVVPHEGGDYMVITTTLNHQPFGADNPKFVLLRRNADELARKIYLEVLEDQLKFAKDNLKDSKGDFKDAEKELTSHEKDIQKKTTAIDKARSEIDMLKAQRQAGLDRLPDLKRSASTGPQEVQKEKQKEVRKLEGQLEDDSRKIRDNELEIVENQNAIRVLETERTTLMQRRQEAERAYLDGSARVAQLEAEQKRVKRLKF